MRKLLALCLVLVLALGPLSAPAEAGRKFGTGFAAGAATVLFLHHVSQPHIYYRHYHAVPYYPVYYYYPAPVYYYPAPVYSVPPPPCRSVWIEGSWREVPRDQGGGFTTYYREWVPGRWQQVCP